MRAEIRRHGHLAHLRARTPRARRDARRRRAGRRRDGQRAHGAHGAPAPAGRGMARPFRNPGRDPDALRLVRPPQRRARGQRRTALRQPPQRRRRNAQAAVVGRGGPARTGLHALPAGGRRTAFHDPLGEFGKGPRMGLQGLGCGAHLPQRRGDRRIHRTLGHGAARTPLPDGRRGDQGQRLRRAAPAGIHGQGPEMGRGL